MSATITWVIEWMNASTTEIDGHSEVVINAGWRCNGSQASADPQAPYTATVCGIAAFPAPEGSFTPYADLTQDQVLGWCWADGVDKDATEAAVQFSIDSQINPPVTNPSLPWATV